MMFQFSFSLILLRITTYDLELSFYFLSCRRTNKIGLKVQVKQFREGDLTFSCVKQNAKNSRVLLPPCVMLCHLI